MLRGLPADRGKSSPAAGKVNERNRGFSTVTPIVIYPIQFRCVRTHQVRDRTALDIGGSHASIEAEQCSPAN